MEYGTKIRLLYLYQYLLEHTDPDHPQSTAELTKMLKDDYDLKVSRNTISNDLAILRESDLHIEYIESTQNKYFYNGRPFEVSELKILIDALSSARFITPNISSNLIAKLLTLTTEENAQRLRRHISVTDLYKSSNHSGYYSVDVINNAVDLHRKIRFYYTDFDVNKKRYITNNGKPYTISPYELTWDGDYYYVRGFCDERQAMRTFRLDRIKAQPVILHEIAATPPEGYNPEEYHKAVFRMYDTDEPKEVTLFCHVSAMKYLIDNFGQRFWSEPVDEEHFRAKVRVCTSTTFYRWVFGFTGSIRIEGPEEIVEEYREQIRSAAKENGVL